MGFFARLFGWLRRSPPQPVYDERDAYERCHGARATEIVVMLKPPPAPRVLPKLAGDHLRRCFEERLESRRVVRHGVQRPEPLGQTGIVPQDDRPSRSADEDPLELLRREAVAAARRSGGDAVEALDLAESLEVP
ncbi:MAG TPA: hypothetical protein VKB10_08535 [Gaiellaceae bacterium]|nr:hypothetical protein [Gaiellaceae bacterium]